MGAGQDSLAIITGQGDLPRLLAQECARTGRAYHLVLFNGYCPDWAAAHPSINAVFERPGDLFRALTEVGCTGVVFAGGMVRPRLNVLKFDLKLVRLAASLLPALNKGDDVTLRAINAVFEAEGLKIVAPHSLLEGLLAPAGIPTRAQPSQADREDAQRAARIVAAIGAQDVGQGAVVAQGICLGVESIQGTDAMLDFVVQTGAAFRRQKEGAKGLLLKAPKPGQDWRVDLPAIGPDTLRRAADAGLAGVVVEAGGVLVLGLEETVTVADDLGLFFWGREGRRTDR
jgi:UDP-2,3-diacylglucosamine hydrolase